MAFFVLIRASSRKKDETKSFSEKSKVKRNELVLVVLGRRQMGPLLSRAHKLPVLKNVLLVQEEHLHAVGKKSET